MHYIIFIVSLSTLLTSAIYICMCMCVCVYIYIYIYIYIYELSWIFVYLGGLIEFFRAWGTEKIPGLSFAREGSVSKLTLWININQLWFLYIISSNSFSNNSRNNFSCLIVSLAAVAIQKTGNLILQMLIFNNFIKKLKQFNELSAVPSLISSQVLW